MLTTPVLFLIFNRPDLTERSFAKIKEAKPSILFIAADGPRENKEGEAELCGKTRKIVLENIDWDCEVKTLLRDTNLGCKVAVSSAINWFFENIEYGIILEDDIYPDNSFFLFCEEMLVRYKDDKRITQVSGVNVTGISEKDSSYFFSKAGGIWGWATWRRAWASYDPDIKSWGDKVVRNEIRRFIGKKDWFDRIKGSFDEVYNKQLDTWDYQWVYTQLKLKGLAIIPVKNLIQNIGFRADATHTHSTNELLESKMKMNSLNFPLKHPVAVISDDAYTADNFNLFKKSQPYLIDVFGKIKARIKNGIRKIN